MKNNTIQTVANETANTNITNNTKEENIMKNNTSTKSVAADAPKATEKENKLEKNRLAKEAAKTGIVVPAGLTARDQTAENLKTNTVCYENGAHQFVARVRYSAKNGYQVCANQEFPGAEYHAGWNCKWAITNTTVEVVQKALTDLLNQVQAKAKAKEEKAAAAKKAKEEKAKQKEAKKKETAKTTTKKTEKKTSKKEAAAKAAPAEKKAE